MRLKHLPLLAILLLTISIALIPGSFASWKYAGTILEEQDSNLSMLMDEFYYTPEEVLPGDDGATELHQNHYNLVTNIVDHIDYGLNASKKPIIRKLLEDGEGVVYSNQNVSGGNLKHMLLDSSDVEKLMFAVEYGTDTEYYAYTFSSQYVTSDYVGKYIAVYKTIMVKNENGKWIATTSFVGQAKVFRTPVSVLSIDVKTWEKT